MASYFIRIHIEKEVLKCDFQNISNISNSETNKSLLGFPHLSMLLFVGVAYREQKLNQLLFSCFLQTEIVTEKILCSIGQHSKFFWVRIYKDHRKLKHLNTSEGYKIFN